MKSSRLSKYLLQKSNAKNAPITLKSDVKKSSDKHIDQDFKGFPDGQAKESIINPKTKQEKKTAAVDVKDGEKKIKPKKVSAEDKDIDNGSGGAFEGTELVKE